jgi:hypothetical protein
MTSNSADTPLFPERLTQALPASVHFPTYVALLHLIVEKASKEDAFLRECTTLEVRAVTWQGTHPAICMVAHRFPMGWKGTDFSFIGEIESRLDAIFTATASVEFFDFFSSGVDWCARTRTIVPSWPSAEGTLDPE